MTMMTTEENAGSDPASPGTHPELLWLPVADLVLEPSYQHRLEGTGRIIVDRIARGFSWACFLAVVVTPGEAGSSR